jgi:hypothetical protein
MKYINCASLLVSVLIYSAPDYKNLSGLFGKFIACNRKQQQQNNEQ